MSAGKCGLEICLPCTSNDVHDTYVTKGPFPATEGIRQLLVALFVGLSDSGVAVMLVLLSSSNPNIKWLLEKPFLSTLLTTPHLEHED